MRTPTYIEEWNKIYHADLWDLEMIVLLLVKKKKKKKKIERGNINIGVLNNDLSNPTGSHRADFCRSVSSRCIISEQYLPWHVGSRLYNTAAADSKLPL